MRARVAGIVAASAALVAVAGGCGTTGRVEQSTDVARGKELFTENCGSCHTLADAGTQGTIGPNLDQAFAYDKEQGFDETTIRDVVRGQIAYPVSEPPTGAPGMPANIVEGDDAEAVASYVAAVAGSPGASGAGGEITATGGKEIFAAAGCGGCHTLADAGTSGTVGPNLDQAKPSAALVTDRVTNGAGAMPSFGDRLSAAQIEAVAQYVSESAGGGR